jgi:hypothetical protein
MLTEVASDHLLEPTLEELSEMTQATICQVVLGFIQGSSDILVAELFAIYQGLILAWLLMS